MRDAASEGLSYVLGQLLNIIAHDLLPRDSMANSPTTNAQISSSTIAMIPNPALAFADRNTVGSVAQSVLMKEYDMTPNAMARTTAMAISPRIDTLAMNTTLFSDLSFTINSV
jgi:hypothetical protein